MSIKGFPSKQKLPLGSGITNDYATVIPVDENRVALDTQRFAFRVGGDVARTAAASTGNIDGLTWVYDTATPAKVGDFIRFETGSNAYLEVPIVKKETNRFMLGAYLSTAPASGDTFYIMRSATQRLDSSGTQLATVAPSPISFVLDSVDTEVEQDTAVPANSIPLPVIQLNSDGTEFDSASHIGSLTETAPGTDTASSGLNGRLQRIAQRLTSLIALLPSSIGQKASAGSLSTVLSTEQEAILGALTESAPGTDTASSGLNGRLQRIAQRLTSLIALFPATLGQTTKGSSLSVSIASDDDLQAKIGIVTETAPGTDTASSGLNGRLQRIAQNITSLIALLPTSLGTKAAANSLATTWSTEDEALVGSLTETAPGTDTASSGLNGRLQRIAQRITSLIALLPTSLGSKTSANSFAVVVASDQAAVATKSPVNTSGSVANTSLTATTASTASVPANAVGFILQAKQDNTDSIRWCIGSTASTTAGLLLEPSRATGFVPCAANVSVCATASGTNAFEIQWILSS